MAECCIVGCSNKAGKRGGVKFYTLPTSKSSRPNKVKRRRLWLEAIQKANGSSAGQKDDAQICSAHFVSGQMSLEESNQDFVPSVFPKHPEKSRRETLRPRSGVPVEPLKVTPRKKSLRKHAKSPEEVLQFNNVYPEINYCEPLEDEDFMEEEEEEEEDKTPVSTELVTTQPTELSTPEAAELSPLCTNETAIEDTQVSTTEVTTTPPIEVPPEYPPLKKPKLELKSVVTRLGRFQCEVCNGKFSSGTTLVKHKQLHDQEWSEDESWPSVAEKASEESDISDIPVPVEEFTFKCNMCDRSFPTTHSLKRHKLLHVRDARKCKQCGTMFCKRHNHIVALPQISTETSFERSTEQSATDEPAVDQMQDNSCADDNLNESLDLLLNADSETLEAIAAAQNQPVEVTEKKPVPNITISPRKTGLLTAFRSFLTKNTVPKIKTEVEQRSICVSNTTQNLESTQVVTDTIVKSPVINETTSAVTTPSATTSASFTTTTITKSVPEQSSKTVPERTSTSVLAPKPVFLITDPSRLLPGQTAQKSTICLSFSQSLPSNVVKEFMSLITKNDSSGGPRLIVSKPVDPLKQDVPANQTSSTAQVETAAIPIQVPKLQHKPTALPKEDKPTITPPKKPAPLKKILPSPVKASSSVPPIISPEKSVPTAKRTRQIKQSHSQASSDKYIHGPCPPTPTPIVPKMQRGPWDSPLPFYPKDFIQPHLPQMPELPPSLQMFSPQFLTSAFLDVQRNYDYILSK